MNTPPALLQREVGFIPTEQLMKMTSADLLSLVMKPDPNQPPKKGPWGEDESIRLVRLVQMLGPREWTSLSGYMGSRNAKQCRERYHQNLDPTLRHDPISDKEAKLIMDYYAKYGSAWARIAEHLPGRSDNTIKNYVNGLVNKSKRASGRSSHQSQPQNEHQQTAARRRRSSKLSVRAAGAAAAAAGASSGLTPSPLHSPTFSDMTESDGGSNYGLSSTWTQVPAGASAPPHWGPVTDTYRPSHPLTHRPASYKREDARHPASRSSDPCAFSSRSTRPSTDLARYSLSGPPLREAGPPVMRPRWLANETAPTPILPSPRQYYPSPALSARFMTASHRGNGRMAIANLLA